MHATKAVIVNGILVQAGERLYWPKRKGKVKGQGGSIFEAMSLAMRAHAVRTRAAAVVDKAPPVMVKITGGGRGSLAIFNHFTYITRHGKLEMENERGEKIDDKRGLSETIDEWRHSTHEIIPRKSHRREAFNIMFSMPPDRDASIVKDAVRDLAQKEFKNHPFVFVLHTPEVDEKTKRSHVHLAVRAEGFDGKRLNPRKADIQRWREVFAHELQRRGMDANAHPKWMTNRFKKFKTTWKLHAEQRGGRVDYPDKPLSETAVRQQASELNAWNSISNGLRQSENANDRLLGAALASTIGKQQTLERPSPQIQR